MARVDFATRTIHLMAALAGAPLAGKASNLEWIQTEAPAGHPEDAVSFREFILDLPPLEGLAIQLRCCRVPPADQGRAKALHAFRGADGVAFIASSDPDAQDENVAALEQALELLQQHGLGPTDVSWVFQWNKRDLADAVPCAELARRLNHHGAPAVEAVAHLGVGVLQTLLTLGELARARVAAEHGLDPRA